jgi:6,7-dimethyl-8-ribityllumazine synthase
MASNVSGSSKGSGEGTKMPGKYPVGATHEGSLRAEGKRFAIIASRFNDFMVDKLVEGALDALRRSGAASGDVELFLCPGAFEIPALLRRVAATGRFHGAVCLGIVIRGATSHYDLVVGEATSGVARIAAEAQLAIGNGVLACESIEQAVERSGSKAGNRGYDAAMVAIEMANLFADSALAAGSKGA